MGCPLEKHSTWPLLWANNFRFVVMRVGNLSTYSIDSTMKHTHTPKEKICRNVFLPPCPAGLYYITF